MKLSEDEAKHIVALQRDPHFIAFMGVLSEEAEVIVESLVKKPLAVNEMYLLKGRAYQITSILEAVNEAAKLVNQYEGKD